MCVIGMMMFTSCFYQVIKDILKPLQVIQHLPP